jgi:ABC-type iron transport system FetAB ATPase subunit
VHSGQLLCVCGPVGGGKTALLLGVLDELRLTGGHCTVRCGSVYNADNAHTHSAHDNAHISNPIHIHTSSSSSSSNSGNSSSSNNTNTYNVPQLAYCAQSPYLHAGSVRDNILMGCVYEYSRYTEIVEGCQLTADIQVMCDVIVLCVF